MQFWDRILQRVPINVAIGTEQLDNIWRDLEKLDDNWMVIAWERLTNEGRIVMVGPTEVKRLW